jgi:DNA-binding CsgD family transcriptional regulator
MTPPDRPIPPDRQHVSAALREAREAMTPEMREAHAARRISQKQRAARRWQEKMARQRRMVELLCSGYSNQEIARALGAKEDTVTSAFKAIWPFPRSPGSRYVVVKLTLAEIAALDALAGSLLLSRLRALEETAKACLEQNAFHARRLLRAPSGEAARAL